MTFRLTYLTVAIVTVVSIATDLRANITAADFAGNWSLEKTDPFNEPLYGLLTIVVGSDGSITIQTYGSPAQTLATASLTGDALKFDVPQTSMYHGNYVVSYSLGLNGDVTQTSPVFLPSGNQTQTLSFDGVHQGAPTITQQPYFDGYGTYTSRQVQMGTAITIRFAATSDSAVTYQWRKDGNDVSGATSATFGIDSTTPAQSGTYSCLLRNASGSVLTKGVTLTVYDPTPPPTDSGSVTDGSHIAAPPADIVIDPTTGLFIAQHGFGAPEVSVSTHTSDTPPNGGFLDSKTTPLATGTSNALKMNPGSYVSFNAYATGTRPVQVQWTENGTAIPGATGSTFAIAAITEQEAGTYGCTVTNSFGTSTWSVVITVPKKPVILTEAFAGVAALGQHLQLAAHVTSASAPLSFQWYHDGVAIAGATTGSYSGTAVPVDATTSYDIPAATASDQGNYWCGVTNAGGTIYTETVTVSFAPTILQSPSNASVRENQPVTLTARATSVGDSLQVQWLRNGVPIPGATSGSIAPPIAVVGAPPTAAKLQDVTSTYSLSAAEGTDAGAYTCRFTGPGGSSDTTAAQVDVGGAARIVNLSTRVLAGGVAAKPVCGFVIRGDQPMSVILRAVGPTLSNFGITNPLPDPFLLLHSPQEYSNDSWDASTAGEMAAVGAFGLPAHSKDAVIIAPLDPQGYTADAYDASGAQGIMLFEVYDANPQTSVSRLVNASTRGYVGAGDQAMFPGFVVSGNGTVNVLLRAVGPGLTGFGVTDAITDPQIQVFRDSKQIAANDNWSDGTDPTPIEDAAKSVAAFSLARGSKDAAMVLQLSAGTYSAEVSGVNGATGTALVELYLLP